MKALKRILIIMSGLGFIAFGGLLWWGWQQFQTQPSAEVQKQVEITVLFPEGWRIEEMAARLTGEKLITNPGEFYSALSMPDQFGQLFPDTYRFAESGSADAIVLKMLANYKKRIAGFTVGSEDLILASIVEREAKHDEDRAAIAGVYANRLKLGMKLDADPTVQYAKANELHLKCVAETYETGADCLEVNWWPVLLRADYLSIQSPYNTYLNAGLPPAPISNPGLASIQAALKPAEHDYLYFITDKEGKAHFAKTIAEHQENIVQYLQ
ncbi:endolytic transglycosylase MltG [Candidatus Berkelbacteria bacterium]|nr:endolytic transglycosylase MltG [Candidatus Berkelbacteria bacterium]